MNADTSPAGRLEAAQLGKTPPMAALRTFASLVKLGSITAVAEDLCLSYAAVSHQVRALELFLDVKLVAREGRSLTLTDAGRTYGYQVRQALQEISRATQSIRGASDLPQETSLVRISVLPSLAHCWLVPRLDRFVKRCPGIRLSIDATLEVVDMAQSEPLHDMAIRFGHGHWPGVQAQHLMADELLLVGTPGQLDGRERLAIPDACALPFLQITESWSTWINAAGDEHHGLTQPQALFTFSDSSHMLKAVRMGVGVALTRKSLVRDFLHSGELVDLTGHRVPHPSNYYVVLPAAQPASEVVRSVIEWLRHEVNGDLGLDQA